MLFTFSDVMFSVRVREGRNLVDEEEEGLKVT